VTNIDKEGPMIFGISDTVEQFAEKILKFPNHSVKSPVFQNPIFVRREGL
jgi:hypothetical protein